MSRFQLLSLFRYFLSPRSVHAGMPHQPVRRCQALSSPRRHAPPLRQVSLSHASAAGLHTPSHHGNAAAVRHSAIMSHREG